MLLSIFEKRKWVVDCTKIHITFEKSNYSLYINYILKCPISKQ